MANQPRRRQPFRFWLPFLAGPPPPRPPPPVQPAPLWSRPTSPSQPPPQAQPIPALSPTTTQRPALPTQPVSPSPSNGRVPQSPPTTSVTLPAPSPTRESPRAQQPSLSPTDSKKQASIPTISRSPSPSPTASRSPLVSQEVTQRPSSLSPPAPSQPESMQAKQEHITSRPTSQPEPKPQESQPLAEREVKPFSPRVLKPEAPQQIASQAEAPDQTLITKASHPSEEETRPSQDIEPKATPAPSTEKITPAQQPKSTIEETEEQKPQTSPEATQLIQPPRLPQEEKPTDISEEKPKPAPAPSTEIITPAQQPKSTIEETKEQKLQTGPEATQLIQPSQLPQEEKPTEISEEKPKPAPAPSTEIITPAQQPKTTIEETKEQKLQTGPEATQFIQPSRLPQEEKPTEISEEKPKPEPVEMQPMSPTQKPESKTVIPRTRTDEPKTKPETQQTEKTPPTVTQETVQRIERSDSSPTRSEADTGEIVTEMRISRPTMLEKQVGTARNGQERNIAIPSIPPVGERGSFETELKEGINKLVQKLSIGQPKRSGNGNAVTMITLAGENKGASMVISYDTAESEGLTYIQRDRKLDKDKIDTIKRYDGSHIERQAHTDNGKEAITTSINSNVQSVNNSLLHESSCNERDPGVHLTISTRPTEPLKPMEKPEAHEAFKVASSTTPVEKLTYKPNIRRRCLRGLFLESSEDDPENPQKPQRHGCRFSCDDKNKGKADNAKHAEEGTSRA